MVLTISLTIKCHFAGEGSMLSKAANSASSALTSGSAAPASTAAMRRAINPTNTISSAAWLNVMPSVRDISIRAARARGGRRTPTTLRGPHPAKRRRANLRIMSSAAVTEKRKIYSIRWIRIVYECDENIGA